MSRRLQPRTHFWANREASSSREAIFRSLDHEGGANVVRCLGRRALGLMASSVTCVQRHDGSQDSAIHTKYHILL
ncbi:LOW QUALITY PROTEIN: hypothetical protein TorRG33x02_173910 [Trema orientale]|uniref:Uncharacterized protein n=1 Tax=Trema orientale TaxID=63057 RepID=A0A2P5EN17_TREOI|nr:LOW QUALITY PROTEIN: hypothetical protein TorRG33x02_173910 [Trema orientale]